MPGDYYVSARAPRATSKAVLVERRSAYVRRGLALAKRWPVHYRASACTRSASTPLSWEYKEIRCDRHLSEERSERRRAKGASEAKEEWGRRTYERKGWFAVRSRNCQRGRLSPTFPPADFHTFLTVSHSRFASLYHPFRLSRSHPRFAREASRPLLTGFPLARYPEIARKGKGSEGVAGWGDGGEKAEGGC